MSSNCIYICGGRKHTYNGASRIPFESRVLGSITMADTIADTRPTDARQLTGIITIRGTVDTDERSAPWASGRQREPAPAEDQWARHQQTIKRLYLEERMTLARVIEVMERDFKFRATCVRPIVPQESPPALLDQTLILQCSTKTYKNRLRAWGYRKNLKLEDGEIDNLSRVLAGEPHNSTNKISLEDGSVIDRERLAT